MDAKIKIIAALDQRVAVQSLDLPWVDFPAAGIQRKMLKRAGAEVARAISIVRYAPGSRFATQLHQLGEEILVLDGVPGDEYGSYGPGTYLMNPPGSSHAPYSETGCTVLVKLGHLDPADSERVVVDSARPRG